MKNFVSDSDPTVAGASWYLYFGQVLGATTSSPQITQQLAVDHPMHHGSICLAGLGCVTQTGNRNLADFFEITADANGAAYIVYNNTANDLDQQVPIVETGVPSGVVDHTGAEVVMVARQVSGTTLIGTSASGSTDRGVNGLVSVPGDALYDPVNGTTSYDGLDLMGASLTLAGDHLHAALLVKDPSAIATAATAIAAPFVDFVIRWEFRSRLYFAAVEVPVAGAAAESWDGAVQTIDLCSVSACDPHMTTYPGPTVAPSTSHLLTSSAITPGANRGPGAITIDIPLGDVGSPRAGDHLDSVGAYSLVSATSYLVPFNNVLAENDIVPQEIDGTCCFTPVLGASAAPNPVIPMLPPSAATPPQATTTTPNTSTAVPAAGAGVAAVMGLAALGRGARRRLRGSTTSFRGR